MLLGVLALAAVAGLLARRRFRYGAALLVGLVAVAAVAVLTRPTVEPVDVVPSLVTALVGVGSLWLLDRRARYEAEEPDEPTDEATGPHRRGVVIGIGVMVAFATALGGAGAGSRATVRGRRTSTCRPPRTRPGHCRRAWTTRCRASAEWVTPNEDFYRVDTRLDTPVVNTDDWTLTIDGDVENEVTITFDELLEMPMIERDITLTCVSNSVGGEFVGGARWLGVPLQDLLDLAGVGSKADQILSTDFDGMTISTPLALATDGRDAMVCVGMNGDQLPREHGFPVRMVIPGLYGFISATKWLTRLTLTTYDDEQAYWTDRDWATDAPIKISARIDTPRALAKLDSGENIIGGIAWCQQRGRGRHRRGAGRRRRLEAGHARARRRQRLLAAVVLPLGRRARPAQHRRPGDQRRRRDAEPRPREPLPRRRQRHPPVLRDRRVIRELHAIRSGDRPRIPVISNLQRKAVPMKLQTLRRNGGIAATVLALSLGLAACSDDDGGSDASDDTSSSAPADDMGDGSDPAAQTFGPGCSQIPTVR